MRKIQLVATSLLMLASAAQAQVQQVTQIGTIDPGCSSEGATCAADAAFTPAFGGYRAGGSVSWTFNFSPLPMPVSSVQMDVMVVGLWSGYPGNIDPTAGQTGNYLEVNGTPWFAFTSNTDGRDLYSVELSSLIEGTNSFAVRAYDQSNGPRLEGWAGVDYAKITVTYDGDGATTVTPEPITMTLMGTGLAGIAAARRRRKSATS